MQRIRFSVVLLGFMTLWINVLSSHAIASDFIDGIMAYQNGEYAKAISIFERSAGAGDSRAQYWLGTIYEEGAIVPQDYKRAVNWFERAATQGEADAQYNLAVMYRLGQGVVKSNKESFLWVSRAAKQNHSHAQSDLGSMYANGIGVRKNIQRAVGLFQKSADKCNAIGIVNLGRLYVIGSGVRQNIVTGAMWFHVGASLGLGTEHVEGKAEAKEDRDILFDSLNSAQIKKAVALAEPYIKRCIRLSIDKL
jgi:uncharacterized protein